MNRVQRLVRIPVDDADLEGELVVPGEASGIVLFAHGSGSSRHSPRNQAVAEALHDAGLGTLLFDLLTEAEDRVRRNRFEIPLLTDRLVGATRWIEEQPSTSGLPIGYFGASTGAAAALRAASRNDVDVDAIVSRSGRVDLAGDRALDADVACLCIVGSDDTEVLDLNEAVLAELECERRLEIVEGAGRLFDGPGELDVVADLASEWFADHLGE